MKIAVDAMGGDYAPKEIVEGVALARDAYPEIEFLLFGLTDQIQKYLKDDTRIEIKQADEVIEMGDEPLRPSGPKSSPAWYWLRLPLKKGRQMLSFQLVTRVPY
ncbi:phosphate:acyl-ACP acyltransferase PlsX [Lentilactobacillus farraginis DSM 18382 = JCM 14108]|uniref:phosphate acyltransferase n=1 Tax=Lentilactobacillus farraginis DSM 18382 = JCM 14108 TaxID=1423743 RepID=X0QDP0_9LACO|nr:phosphate:acyl-ACP acyltransferase PlsX [Lentilactobacillus farraginis DSM 18382 = JCM 14108]